MRWRVFVVALAALAACAAPQVRVASVRRAPTVHRQGSLRIPILTYHRIGPVSGRWPQLFVKLPTFARQMAALSRVRSMSVGDVYEAVRTGAEIPGGAVAVTFDDGSADQYTYAWPVLRQYGIRATFYIAPGLIGRPGYMTWEQVAELSRSETVTIAAHSASHADLTKIPSAAAREEVVSSRRILESRLRIHVQDFAYPFGAFDSSILTMVREAGFSSAVTTRYGWGRTLETALAWGRIEVHDGYRPADLERLATLSGTWVAR